MQKSARFSLALVYLERPEKLLPESLVPFCDDNGSQFVAGAVRQFLKEKVVLQEFSHVATPEDDAYIEACHSNLQREVIERFEFASIYHAQLIIDR